MKWAFPLLLVVSVLLHLILFLPSPRTRPEPASQSDERSIIIRRFTLVPEESGPSVTERSSALNETTVLQEHNEKTELDFINSWETEDIGETDMTTASSGGSPAHNEMYGNIPPAYPEQARIRGWEGTSVLEITVSKDGNVEDCRLIKSSGYSLLDKSCLDTVQNSWIFPASGEQQILRQTFVFSLQDPGA